MNNTLDLDMILQEPNVHVYVRNSTRPKGKIICTFTDGLTGVTRPFNVPKTWVPICVTKSIPRTVVGGSMDFRRYLSNGMLTLVDAKEAEAILAQVDAQEELKRLNSSEFSSDSKFSSQAAKDLMKSIDAKSEISKLEASERLNVEDPNKDTQYAHPGVLDLCTRFNAKDLSESEAVNTLRILQEELSAFDWNYVIGNADGKVRAFAKESLELLQKNS